MSLPYIQANTDGRLHPAHEPALAPLNRGFLYGDAIYEVWRTYHRVLFAWEEHWSRLERSAAALHLSLPWSRDRILEEVLRTTAAFRGATGFTGELYVRLQVSRGGGPIGLDPALADESQFVLLVQPCPVNSPAVQERGLRLALAHTLRRNPVECLSPAWKTGNYLNNILGLREARARGADEVVMLNQRGEITEASTSNIGFVIQGTVVTPRLDAGILEGITRGIVLGRLAGSLGLSVAEQSLTPGDLAGSEECFLLSTTKGVTPVAEIDEWRFRVGAGTVTARLGAALEREAEEVSRRRPELRT
ncbi:MAG: aminotransferase class IV family protein [Verrucomicrobia bacterium]|nr:aminotransferase class IV family protein [Verrucomicrobiota bacterium]